MYSFNLWSDVGRSGVKKEGRRDLEADGVPVNLFIMQCQRVQGNAVKRWQSKRYQPRSSHKDNN